MKLFHVVPTYAPGGHRRRIATLAEGLGPDFSHCVVAMDGGLGAEPLEPSVRLVPFSGTATRLLHLRTMRDLARLLAQERPQVLITYNWGTIEAALVNRLTHTASHLHCEDGFSGAAALRGEPVRRALIRRLVLSRSMLAVPSRVLANTARRRWAIPEHRIALIRNGIDAARFSKAAAARPSRAEGVVIGMLSRLSPEKNIGLLLGAFARSGSSSPANLVIAGEGPERPALEALAERLGIADRVRFLGHVHDPAGFLSRIDVYALSSVTEQLPFSLLEAMASGLPVVATDVGDVRETLAPANREFVVPAGEEDALARKLSLLLASAELRLSLGAANAERARIEFDQQRMIAEYRSLLHRMEGSSGGAGDPGTPTSPSPARSQEGSCSRR